MKTALHILFLATLTLWLVACGDDPASSPGSDTGGDTGTDAPTCSSPRVICDGECTNPNTDSENCGQCGTTCDSGEICVNGSCVPDCATGQVLCGDACVFTATNPNHCGQCGHVCLPGQSCLGGQCRCPEGLSECASACVDLAKDEANCGQCGRQCLQGEVCEGSQCGPDCPEGWEVCQGACVDVSTDERYCGDCSTHCGANQTCESGDCQCTGTLVECDGVCVDIYTNPAHCNGCDEACAENRICQDGVCACISALTLCNGQCVDVNTNVDNCGECDEECGENEVCVGGDCEVGCPTGQSVCDGVCYNLNTSSAHCGNCQTSCRTDQECVTGNCQCQAGFTVCNNTCVNTQTNPNYCGNCTTPCDPGEVCSAGSCTCGQGLTPCDGACVDTTTSNSHCGACNETCGELERCNNSDCVCKEGFARCGTDCVVLATNPMHCGECFNDCGLGEVCSGGDCGSVCAEPLTSCYGACVDTMTDEFFCGDCDTTCAYIEECILGDCSCVNDFYEYDSSDSLAGAAKFDAMESTWWTPHFDDLRLCGEESDYYVVYLPTEDSTLSVSIYADCADEVLPILSVLDVYGDEVATDDGSTDVCPALVLNDLEGGWYYMVVENVAGSGLYWLDYSITNTSEVEPNESLYESTGPFSGDFEVAGNISTNGDFDYFLLWVPRTTTMVLWTDDDLGSCETDTVLTVFDEDSNVLGEDDDSGVGLCSAIDDLVLHRGYYVVSVSSWWNLSTGSYVLHGIESHEYEIEPNAEIALADGPFGMDYGIEGVVFPAYDRDRFEVVLTNPATIVAEVQGNEDGCMLDSRLELWSETELLGEDDDFDYSWELRNWRGYGYCSRIDPFSTSDDAPDQSWAEDLPVGTYYLIVSGYSDEVGAYNLSVRIVE